MHADKPGYPCEEGCGSDFELPLYNRGLPMKLHTKVPIEGAGVIHVVTKPIECPSGSWETDVTLWRYSSGAVAARVHLTGSGTPAISAQDMHTYWCDLETLTLCVMGVRYALHIIDLDYFDRKHKELGLG